ncbi:hypothetical protein OP10G_0245 [Fimbriimonas ginsengisoli Gsoil 348]|uniref:Uncharacterized protein n=2 Tax=Fimbriimonas ginsengisoli TaxID=1005039 RepID=A0A068NJ48_FIMGI|nr:hypothetical protein OP10G_0245 [Fimbriimonas ginsengisoli Gsoil 348]
MRGAMWGLLALASLGLLSTFVVESGVSGRAVEVQPIERDPRSDTGWRLVGPPTSLMNVPEKAFVTHGAPGVPPQVDAAVVRNTPGVVPLSEILGTLHIARIGALAAMFLMALGLLTLTRFVLRPAE